MYSSTHAHCTPNRSDFKVALYFIKLEYQYYKLQTYSNITNHIYNSLLIIIFFGFVCKRRGKRKCKNFFVPGINKVNSVARSLHVPK